MQRLAAEGMDKVSLRGPFEADLDPVNPHSAIRLEVEAPLRQEALQQVEAQSKSLQTSQKRFSGAKRMRT